MKYANIGAAGIVALLCLAGCDNAKPPQAAANDADAAAQKASTNVAEARKDAAQDDAKMQAQVDDKTRALNNTQAKGAYDVAMKQAEGAHDVALERCKASSGDAQKSCKDQADADYDVAKAKAKATETSRTQP
jgi:hypothetical protein